ncbi:hypothetical protein TI10_20325 [Photorhabdus luminescens subsp. luminescens]|uniref:Phage integrase family protein n=1 Tax=Photorhabdus luminescens TaxID=29488 RepID=A0A1G5QR98_PHOLU|nr:hypothetical protein TI10_20325 [Photorhabdus luminescens subsp. luminescens]SCZ64363.1 Phage integrase family protein [Photorhabdus luminescens]
MCTPHLVLLSRQVLVILKQIHKFSGDRDLIFIGDHDPRKPMSENTVNRALRVMGYDTKVEVCGHGFRTMACSLLIESGLWLRGSGRASVSHQERSYVRAAYIHKAENLGERRLRNGGQTVWTHYIARRLRLSIMQSSIIRSNNIIIG